MRCDDVRLALSLRADGEVPDVAAADVDDHFGSCPDCRRFAAGIQVVRAQLRFEAVDHVPDLGPAVVALLAADATRPSSPTGSTTTPASPPRTSSPPRRAAPPRPSRRRVAVVAAAAAAAGVVAGATFVGLDPDPPSLAAADVPERVVAGQDDVTSLEGRYRISEPGDGGRTFDADLTYRAPESLALRVEETTTGVPAADRSDGILVVDGDRWWHEADRACSPAPALVRCPDDLRWSQLVTGREPFSVASPLPLELVVPVDAFTLAATPAGLGTSTVAGHRAVGVTVTAGQVSGLLGGLSSAVDLRSAYPGDTVELWLDIEHLVPLAVIVRAGDDPARTAWGAATGRAERAGDVVLRVEADEMRINPAGTVEPEVPDGEPSARTDAGFQRSDGGDLPVAVPTPAVPPRGFAPYRAGTVTTPGGPPVGVRAWTDGRAWFTVRTTDRWPGGRLFGDLGLDVRPVDLGVAGQGYASSDGRQVALHAAGIDVVVAGSLPTEDLQVIAADLEVVGEAVPADWAEAGTATAAAADEALPGRLTADDLDGFGDAALRVAGESGGDATVTETRSGPGDRGFVLTQRRGTALPPPSSGGEIGVEVRGTVGRYSPAEGEVAWVEAGSVCTLRSSTLGLGELAALAARLEPA